MLRGELCSVWCASSLCALHSVFRVPLLDSWNIHTEHACAHEEECACSGLFACDRTLTPFPSHDVSYSTKVVIQIFHKSSTKKKNRKRNLIGTASLSCSDFVKKYPPPHPHPIETELRLSSPPAQRKMNNNATITMRIAVPQSDPRRRAGRKSSFVYESEDYETEGHLSDAPSCMFLIGISCSLTLTVTSLCSIEGCL